MSETQTLPFDERARNAVSLLKGERLLRPARQILGHFDRQSAVYAHAIALGELVGKAPEDMAVILTALRSAFLLEHSTSGWRRTRVFADAKAAFERAQKRCAQ